LLFAGNREQAFKKLTVALADADARRVDAGDKSFRSLYNSITLAALTGSDADVLKQVQRLVDNDGLGVNLFDTPIFDRMKDNAEFQKLNATLLKRANSERAKLGLDPYRPVSATEILATAH